MILIGDVSEFQGPNFNFKALATAGVRACYVKAQQGNDHPNQYFDEQVEAGVAAGLDMGAYHFSEPLPEVPGRVNRDPLGQAQLFFAATAAARARGDLKLPPMQDLEWPVAAAWVEWGVTGTSIARWAAMFAAHVDAMWLRSCGIYIDPSFAASLPQIELTMMRFRALWGAAYPIGGFLSAPPSASPPSIPPWGRPTLWQFTDKFSVPGCQACDCSVFLGDETAYQAFLDS